MIGRIARPLPASLVSLGHAHYRLFVGGALVSGTANWMVRLAQTLVLIDLAHGGAAQVGLLAATQYLPIVLLGTHVGMWADRRSKPLVLCMGQLLMAVTAAGSGVLAAAHHVTTATTFGVAAVFGVGAAIDGTVRLSLAPELVPAEQIANAVSLNTVSLQVGRLLGPALGGLLAATVGFAPVFFLGAAAFVVFAVMLTGLERRSAVARPVGSRGGVLQGLRYVRRDRDLMIVLGLVGVGGLVGPNLALIATVMVHDAFHGGSIRWVRSRPCLRSGRRSERFRQRAELRFVFATSASRPRPSA